MSATPLCDKLSELGHDLMNHISDPYQRECMLLEVEPLLAKLVDAEVAAAFASLFNFPAATPADKKSGWALSTSFLLKVMDAVSLRGEDVSMEQIESVILSLPAIASQKEQT